MLFEQASCVRPCGGTPTGLVFFSGLGLVICGWLRGRRGIKKSDLLRVKRKRSII
jgi:hypothetical protein